jgi:hypothetical protein
MSPANSRSWGGREPPSGTDRQSRYPCLHGAAIRPSTRRCISTQPIISGAKPSLSSRAIHPGRLRGRSPVSRYGRGGWPIRAVCRLTPLVVLLPSGLRASIIRKAISSLQITAREIAAAGNVLEPLFDRWTVDLVTHQRCCPLLRLCSVSRLFICWCGDGVSGSDTAGNAATPHGLRSKSSDCSPTGSSSKILGRDGPSPRMPDARAAPQDAQPASEGFAGPGGARPCSECLWRLAIRNSCRPK